MIHGDLLLDLCRRRKWAAATRLRPRKDESGRGYENCRHTEDSCWWLGDKDGRLHSCFDYQSQGHSETEQGENEAVECCFICGFFSFSLVLNTMSKSNIISPAWAQEKAWLSCSYVCLFVFLTELNQTARTFFPKEYLSRKQNFQKASCAKWPLPSCRKLFRIFGGKFLNTVPPVKTNM